MKAMWKKTLLAVLPLAGLLLTAPAAFARDHHHHRWENRQHCRPDYGRGWRNRWRHDDDDYRPGWYGGRRHDDNYQSGWYSGRRYNDRDDYYRSRDPQQFYGSPWWQSYFYR